VNPTLEKIKGRGHWYIRFRGERYNPQRLETQLQSDELIQRLVVSLRGWDYPHYPREGAIFGPNYCEGTVDWEGHIEFWRFYQSGQFVHYLALREDWIAQDSWLTRDPRFANLQPGSALFVISTIYTLTEVFELLRRLTSHDIYGDAVTVSLELSPIDNRHLRLLDDFRRAPLMDDYVCRVPKFDWDKTYRKDEVLETSSELALEVIQKLFLLFQWRRQPIGTFRGDQQALLKKLV
jgi:hypothetical protein